MIAAIESACLDGTRTRDVGGSATTEQVGDAIAARVARQSVAAGQSSSNGNSGRGRLR